MPDTCDPHDPAIWLDSFPTLAPASLSSQANKGIYAYEPAPCRTVEASVAVRPLERHELPYRLDRYNNLCSEPLGERDLAAMKRIPCSILKVWLDVARTRDAAGKLTRMDAFHGYLDQAGQFAETLLANVGGQADVLKGRRTLRQFEDDLFEALLHFKRRCPKLEYVEALNEFIKDTDYGDTAKHERYFEFYQVFARAAARVNAALGLGRGLKVGGPIYCYFGGWAIKYFLDRVAATGTPLDFVAYHEYLFEARNNGKPATIRYEAPLLRQWLAQRKLDASMPIFVTEHGLFPQGGMEGTADHDADLLTQAAGMATNGYYYLSGGRDAAIPFHWVIRHPQNDRKNLLAKGRDGLPTPYYNMVQMQSMLKAGRLSADTGAATPDGIGLHVIATGDDSGVAVMLWNFQWVDGRTSFKTALGVKPLPPELAGRELRVERYLIDAQHSNYSYDEAKAGLEKVEEFVLPPGEAFATTLPLGVNAMSLLVLSPVGPRR